MKTLDDFIVYPSCSFRKRYIVSSIVINKYGKDYRGREVVNFVCPSCNENHNSLVFTRYYDSV